MDANDAASYVQDLAGDDANIIFGAKFDETMTDEATITVIATGLEEVNTPIVAATPVANNTVPTMQGRMVYPTQQPAATTVRPTTTIQRPVTPMPQATTQSVGSAPSLNSNFTGIQRPKQPESTVKPVEINIPDFLKNSKR